MRLEATLSSHSSPVQTSYWDHGDGRACVTQYAFGLKTVWWASRATLEELFSAFNFDHQRKHSMALGVVLAFGQA